MSATVNGTAVTYEYDGEGVRVGKDVAGTPTSYLWDRQSGLPLLVDDGSKAYLHADGPLAQIDDSGARENLLLDGPDPVCGVSER